MSYFLNESTGLKFNNLFKINQDLKNTIFNWCAKYSEPYSIKDKNIKIQDFDARYNDKDKKNVLHTILKIYNTNKDKFYLVRFTYDNNKIYHIESLVVNKSLTSRLLKIIPIKDWKNINQNVYIK